MLPFPCPSSIYPEPVACCTVPTFTTPVRGGDTKTINFIEEARRRLVTFAFATSDGVNYL